MALLVGSLTRSAVVGLLEAESDLTVYPDGAPDRAQPPYVTAWLSTDLEDPDRLEGASNRAWWRITTHSVGRTPELALRVQGLVRAALLDARPDVDGAPVTRVRHSNGRPPVTDESTGVSVSDIVDQWTFQTWPTRNVVVDDGSGFAPLDGVSDPWRWVAAWDGWAVAAYECSWTTGDMLPYVPLVDRGAADIMGVYVGPVAASFAEFETPFQRQSDPSHDDGPTVGDAQATFDTTASGMVLVFQYEAAFTHTTAPEPTFDPTDSLFVGPLVIGPPITF